jgi:hypothetical protein
MLPEQHPVQMLRFRNNVAEAASCTNGAVLQHNCRSSILYKWCGSSTMLPEQHTVQIMRFRNNVAGAASCTNVAIPQQCCRSSILYKWCGSAT